MTDAGAKRVAYFVHDLQDAAVARRIGMFHHAGHDVQVTGFYRRDTAPTQVQGAPAHNLGRTRDGGFKARVVRILANMVFAGVLDRGAAGADVLVARNLETLVLAVRVRRQGQRLVYECLDIHRLMLGQGMVGRAMRGIERWAMRRLDLLVVSSPSFLDAYFRGISGYGGQALLVENKVPAYARDAVAAPQMDDMAPGQAPLGTPGEPWVIGWFGMLRCRKTLAMLAHIAASSGGCIRVIIAGKPSPAEFPDFAAQVAAMPGVSYEGPYAASDLPRLYGRLHFVWSIDYFEEGMNSRWLLPNRLYEGIAHGAVPIALSDVATGQWLARRGIGLRLRSPVEELSALLAAMSFAEYRQLRAKVAAVQSRDVLLLPDEHAECVAQILGTQPVVPAHQPYFGEAAA